MVKRGKIEKDEKERRRKKGGKEREKGGGMKRRGRREKREEREERRAKKRRGGKGKAFGPASRSNKQCACEIITQLSTSIRCGERELGWNLEI